MNLQERNKKCTASNERFGATAADTKRSAGYSLSNLHCTFCGLLPPLRQIAR